MRCMFSGAIDHRPWLSAAGEPAAQFLRLPMDGEAKIGATKPWSAWWRIADVVLPLKVIIVTVVKMIFHVL